MSRVLRASVTCILLLVSFTSCSARCLDVITTDSSAKRGNETTASLVNNETTGSDVNTAAVTGHYEPDQPLENTTNSWLDVDTGTTEPHVSTSVHDLTPDLQSETTSDLHRRTTPDLHRKTTNDLHRETTSDLHCRTTSDLHRETTSDLHHETTSDQTDLHRGTTSDLHRETTPDLHRETTSDLHRETTPDFHHETTSDLHRETTNDLHRETTPDLHRETTSDLYHETTNDLHHETTPDLRPKITSDLHHTITIDDWSHFSIETTGSSVNTVITDTSDFQRGTTGSSENVSPYTHGLYHGTTGYDTASPEHVSSFDNDTASGMFVDNQSDDNDTLWLPGNMTLAEWRTCHGMTPQVCRRYRMKLQILNEIISAETNNSQPALITDPDQSGHNDTVDGGILYSEEQLDAIFEALSEKHENENTKSGKRKKRNLNNFATHPETKWELPIIYKFDGSQNANQQAIIRSAYQHWMDNTCVTFQEQPKDAQITKNHVLISSSGSGCYGYVGKVSVIPQQMNLADACLFRFGTPVHEIGHSLGLWHEQMRVDRDDWITVVWDNIFASYQSQFSTTYQSDSLGVPYDLGSVMQYSSLDSVSITGLDTMIAKEPFYQKNMGQRVGLSFSDIKIINLGYCKSVCKNQLKTPCLRGGYQNPKDCSRCFCPDGFSGVSCETIAPPVNAVCGGEINLVQGQPQVIKSPGYDSPRFYNSHQQCNWWIKAPTGQKIQLNFNGDFGLYCQSSSCYHWVEIKYKKDLGLQGGRFCCYQLPKAVVVSESNEMMIVFRSNYTSVSSAQRGFQVTVSSTIIAKDQVPSTKRPTGDGNRINNLS